MMDEVLGVLGNVTRMLAIFGGGVAAITICFAGIQFMTGAGDPQKMAQARMSLIGTIGGLILVGVAFIIPRFVAETVTTPVGGISIAPLVGSHCDGILRTQLVFQTAVSQIKHFQRVVNEIQAEREECRADIWAPVIYPYSTIQGANSIRDACFGTLDDDHKEDAMIGGQSIPASLHDGGLSDEVVRGASGRDARNNILVYWNVNFRPSDGSVCWLYLRRTGTWFENYKK